MGIKYSTGRRTRVKHSTGLEWEDLEKTKKKYDPIKHSTGEDSLVRHATGTEFDYKALYEKERKTVDAKGGKDGIRLWDGTIVKREKGEGLHSKLRSKPKEEGEVYLDLYREALYQALMETRRKRRDSEK